MSHDIVCVSGWLNGNRQVRAVVVSYSNKIVSCIAITNGNEYVGIVGNS